MTRSAVKLAKHDLNAQQLTSTTRVIISFGGRGGGFELTNQLRLDIMDRYGRRRIRRHPDGRFKDFAVSDESFCYLDAITLQQAPDTFTPRVKLPKAGKDRLIDANKMVNDFWDCYYPRAVRNAVVMVFQISEWWLGSEYCRQELGWYLASCMEKLQRGEVQPCIFLVFDNAKAKLLQLFDALESAIRDDRIAEKFRANEDQRMVGVLQEAMANWKELEAARRPSARTQVGRVVQEMRERCFELTVNPEDKLSFTDYYDDKEQYVRQDPKEKDPPAHEYTHTFEFNYSLDAKARRDFFAQLDKDLRPHGIHPVKLD